jgi:3-oxoacyl-[acyl-carrier-protein] synthase III
MLQEDLEEQLQAELRAVEVALEDLQLENLHKEQQVAMRLHKVAEEVEADIEVAMEEMVRQDL